MPDLEIQADILCAYMGIRNISSMGCKGEFMKKPAIKAGLLVFAFLATLSVQQIASAIESKKDFSLGDIAVQTKSTDVNENAQVGQVLAETTEQTEGVAEVIEAEPEVIVEVTKGDSLSKIAKAHDTNYKRLFDANSFIADPNVINPGEKIRIPKAEEVLESRALPVAAPVQATPKAANTTTAKKTKPVQKKSSPQPSTAPAVANGSVWDSLAKCESGGNWSINTGNGYYGGLQFSAATWRAVGGTGLPHQNSREEQIHRAEILLARSGWGQWPACTKKLGLR